MTERFTFPKEERFSFDKKEERFSFGESKVLPQSIAGSAAVGASEVLLSGAGAVLGTVAKGLTLLGGASRETASNVKSFIAPQPNTDMGQAMAKTASVPFEWYDEEGKRVGDIDREAVSWLLQDGLGLDKDTAETAANLFGTTTETAIRAIPYVLGLRAPEKPAEVVAPKETPWGEKPATPEEPIGPVYKEKVIEPDSISSLKGFDTWVAAEEKFPNIETEPYVMKKEGLRGTAISAIIRNKNGEAIGKVSGDIPEGTNEVRINSAGYDYKPDGGIVERVPGAGTKAYAELADWASSKGMRVVSDSDISKSAERVYEKLQIAGYNVIKNPKAKEIQRPFGGETITRIVTEDKSPVFTIAGRTSLLQETIRPTVDYGKLQEAAKAEDLTRSVTKELDKPLPKNPSTYVVDDRTLPELKPELYSVTESKQTKFGTSATEELIRYYTPKALDLPARYGEGGRLIPGRGQYISGRFVGVIKHNPIVKWVDSQARREDLYIKQQYHEDMFGTDVVMKRGKPVYQPTERGWTTRFNSLPLDQRALYSKARNIFDDPKRAAPPARDILESMGMSKEAIDLYYSTNDLLTKRVTTVNTVIKQMQKLGYDMQEFPTYSGYTPHIWIGDFRTFVKDKQGNIIKTLSSDTIVGKQLLEKKLKEEYGDKYQISSYARKDKTNDMSVEAINDIIAKAEEKFPEQAEEIRTFLEGQKEIRGMGIHGLERKGAKGYLGDTEGTPNLEQLSKDTQKSMEIFVHGMLRKEASLRLRFAMDSLREDPVLRKLYPNSIRYSERLVDDFLGRKTLADEIISKYTADVLGQSGVKTVVEKGSAAMTYPILLLGSIPNIAVQPFQIGYGGIKAIGMRNDLGLNAGQVHAAWAKGMLDMFPGKTPELKEVALEAGRRGAVAPEFVQFMHESDALQGRPLENRAWYKDAITGKLLYSLPDEYGRLAQVYGFYETFRAAGKSHEVSKLDAIELAKQYSVPYNNLDRPAAYRGTVGAVIGKFQTWSSNQYAQMLEHIDVAKHGDLLPLAEYLAYSALVSGLYGFWGIQESDALVELINKKFQTTYKLPSMHIAETSPDWLAYGPLQSSLGYATGTTTLPTFNRRLTSFPIIDFYSELVGSTTNLLSKYMGLGSPPDKMDIERTMLAWAPRSMHGPLKVAVEKGDIYLLPNDGSILLHDPKTGKGTYRLDREGQIINYFGGKTVEDHKISLINRWVQGIEDSRKLTVKDWATYVAISSSMGVPVNLDKFRERIAEEYQITPDEFSKAVNSAAEGFNTSIKERVFDVKSKKGQRSGARFFENIEQDKPEGRFTFEQ